MCLTARHVDPADDGPGPRLLSFLSDGDRGLEFCKVLCTWCATDSLRSRSGGYVVRMQRHDFWRCIGEAEATNYTDEEQSSIANLLDGIYVMRGRGTTQSQWLQLSCDADRMTPERLLALFKRNILQGAL